MRDFNFEDEANDDTSFHVDVTAHTKKTLIFGLYSHLGKFENHLDTITARFKNVTLSWFFAVYTAIGFLFSMKSDALPMNHLLAVMILCFIGTIAIGLIWNLDLNVYHRFWCAIFSAESQMEKKHPFLLDSHSILLILDNRRKVLSQSNLYLFTITLFLLTAGISNFYIMFNNNLLIRYTILIGYFLLISILWLLIISLTKKLRREYDHEIKNLS